jgi:hypothetical protein
MRSIGFLSSMTLLIIGIFASAMLLRYGWDDLTYNGHDPWALFFYGARGAFWPIIIATIIAGVRKIGFRSSSFVVTWLWSSAVATVILVAPTLFSSFE